MPTRAPLAPAVAARDSYRVTAAICAIACALAPAYAVRWHLGFYPTTLLENAILVSVAAFAVEYFRNRQPLHWRTPFLIPALLFVVAGGISVLSAPSVTAALGIYRAYLLEPIAFGFVMVNVVRTPGRALLVAGSLFAGAAVAGVANSLLVATALAQHTYNVTVTPPVVIYMTANAVALFVVPLVAVAGALGLHGTGMERPLGAIFFFLGTLITFLSFSRGGYLALAVVVAGLSLSHRRRWLLLSFAVLGAGLLALVPPIRTRVLIETQNVYGNTIASRIDLWTAAVHLLQQRPLLGAGLSGFPQRITPYFTHLHTEANFIYPHNIILNFWVETGLLGLLSMAWIIGTAMAVTWRGWRLLTDGWRPYELGILLAMVAVVVHGMVDVPYFKNDLSLEFWTLVGLACAGRLWSASAVERSPALTSAQALPDASMRSA